MADVIRRLEPGRLLAVVGASGSGKSSLLRAGLVAAPCAPARSTGSRTPRCSFPAPILSLDVRATRRIACSSSTSSRSCSRSAGTPTARRSFIDGLLALRCAVVIGVRADVYARLSGHAGLARAVAANQVLLGPMSADELARAITEPARLAGLRLEPGLVDLVLRDVADEPGALPLLSHALRATWDRRDGRTLTVEGYRESGGVATAHRPHGGRRRRRAARGAAPLARGVFLRVTELGEGIEDTRRRVAIDELVARAAPIRRASSELLRAFGRRAPGHARRRHRRRSRTRR